MQRKIFAKQLLMMIRKSGMRQIEIASKIGVSSAAISQFVHGTTLPTPHHMESIFEILRIPAKTRAQLQYQLMLARSEPRNLSKKSAPISLMPIRASLNLSLAEVAARTDISTERLVELEESANPQLTKEEKERLSEVYGVDFDNGEVSLNDSGDINSMYQNGGAPQIMVSDLIEYSRDETIDQFAWRNIRNFISHTVSGVPRPVLAQAFSYEVGFLHDGLLQIVLAESRPSGFAPMELRMYDGGVFRL